MANTPVWHENPGFWEAFRDLMFPPEKFEEATTQIDHLLTMFDVESNARILDIPCGVGRHAVKLAEHGFQVTAVDATTSFLDTAKDRATDADVEIEFVHADMREFRRPETFDLVLNLYTSFGYFEARDDDERTAQNFYASLNPDGMLVMDLTSKEILAKKFEKRTWDEQDGTYILEEHEVSKNWSWIENRWILVEEDEVEEFSVSHRLYSAYELTELLEHVGFRDVAVYGDFERADFDETAERMVVIAHK